MVSSNRVAITQGRQLPSKWMDRNVLTLKLRHSSVVRVRTGSRERHLNATYAICLDEGATMAVFLGSDSVPKPESAYQYVHK
jgi:hypothetical protein